MGATVVSGVDAPPVFEAPGPLLMADNTYQALRRPRLDCPRRPSPGAAGRGARPAICRPVRDIALVEPLEVVLQPLVGCTDERAQRRAGEVAVLVVDTALMRVPSTASNSRP